MEHHSIVVRSLFAGAISLVAANTSVKAIPILSDFSTPYTQDFNTLAITGTSSSLPDGWQLAETGTGANGTYGAGTGSSTGGDTYSFGATAFAERALGGLQTGSLVPTFGVRVENGTGEGISSLLLSFTGEQWRLGAIGRADRLDFQYSLDATSLTTGLWVDYNLLDFVSPTQSGTVGALNGNANQQVLSAQLDGLDLGVAETIWFRWTDFNAAGADDGLAIDDFSVQALAALPSAVPDRGVTLWFLGGALLPILTLQRRFHPNALR